MMEGLSKYLTLNTSSETRPLNLVELDALLADIDWGHKPNTLFTTRATIMKLQERMKFWEKEQRDRDGYRVHGGYIFRKRRGEWEFVKDTPKRPLRRR